MYENLPDTVRELINNYLEQCDNVTKNEWYCTDRENNETVLLDFLKYVTDVCYVEQAKKILEDRGYSITTN